MRFPSWSNSISSSIPSCLRSVSSSAIMVLPSPTTVSRDVKAIYERTKARVADMLQVSTPSGPCRAHHRLTNEQKYRGRLSFATDAWRSPNHRAYMAVTVHFVKDGKKYEMLLDILEVAEVRAHGLHSSHVMFLMLRLVRIVAYRCQSGDHICLCSGGLRNSRQGE